MQTLVGIRTGLGGTWGSACLEGASSCVAAAATAVAVSEDSKAKGQSHHRLKKCVCNLKFFLFKKQMVQEWHNCYGNNQPSLIEFKAHSMSWNPYLTLLMWLGT